MPASGCTRDRQLVYTEQISKSVNGERGVRAAVFIGEVGGCGAGNTGEVNIEVK